MCGAALPRGAAAHSFSAIEAEYSLAGAEVTATVQLTIHDLTHMVELDSDAAGRFSPASIAASRDRIAAYLIAALPLAAEPSTAPCSADLTDLAVSGIDRVQVRLRYLCPHPPQALTLRSGLFRGTDFDYLLHVRVGFASGEVSADLDPRHNRVTLAPPAGRGDWLVPVLGAGALLALLGAALIWWRGRTARSSS